MAMMATAKTTRSNVEKMSAQVDAALREPDVQQRLVSLGIRPIGSNPDDFAEFLRKDRTKWDDVIRTSKIRLD